MTEENENPQQWPAGFGELVEKSWAIRQEVENGGYQIRTSHQPTDWAGETKAEVREFWAGWKEDWGTCSKCNMMRSANGSCEC